MARVDRYVITRWFIHNLADSSFTQTTISNLHEILIFVALDGPQSSPVI